MNGLFIKVVIYPTKKKKKLHNITPNIFISYNFLLILILFDTNIIIPLIIELTQEKIKNVIILIIRHINVFYL